MRTAIAVLLALAGAASSGAAYLSNARVRPASPWSLAERLAALRIERSLPANVRKQASLTLRGDQAVLRIREAKGPVLLRCPGRDLVAAYAAYAASGSAPGCEAQAVDEVGDLRIYEVSGRVAPLCPGQYATLSEQQLHDALFLPALQLSRDAPAAVLQPGSLRQCGPADSNCALTRSASALIYCGVVRTCGEGACFQGQNADVQPDDVATSLYYYQALSQARTPSSVAPAACGAVPMSVHLSTLISEAITAATVSRFVEAQPWAASNAAGAGNAETAADLRAFFNRQPRGLCLLIRGIDVEGPREAEMVAQSLSFPVFAPADPRSTSRATPLLRALQKAAFDDEQMSSLFARCDLSSERGCRLKRDRMASQLRMSLGKLGPGLGNLAADEMPYHVGASGPFHLADADLLHVTLESTGEVPKANGAKSKLMIRYQPLWPESVAERRLQCQQQPGICLFRSLWNVGTREPGEDGFESLVALFARRDANTRCVRRLFNALASAGEDRFLELQRDLREPVGAGENRSACDPRSRSALGLVPENVTVQQCPAPPPAPFGDLPAEGCRPVSLVYVEEEPWSAAAARIASIAAAKQVAVSVSGVKASEVHRGALGSWDVLLTVASNYYNRKYPTLVPLLHPAGNQNLSGGQVVSEAHGKALLASYESSIVYPPPAWLGTSATPLPRAESLKLLEEDVAQAGPAPIYPLAFLHPGTLTIPESQSEPAQSPWYFAQLLQQWSEQ